MSTMRTFRLQVRRGQSVMSQTKPRFALVQEVLASLTAASGVGYVATAYSLSRWMTRRAPGGPEQTPAALGLDSEPLECRTADGLRLVGWSVAPPCPRATVALFHGLRGNRGQTLTRTAFLVAAGYRCVAFDHRAHGQSDGRRTSFGYYEGRDVAAVLDLVRQRWPHQPRAALGISMGAAAICFAAAEVRGCGAVILESLYHDLAGALHSRIGNDYPNWLRRFVPGLVWMTERRLRLRLRQLVPADWIGRLSPCPVLLLTGTQDSHASVGDAERLYARCPGPKELYLVPGAGHRDVCETGGPAYRRRVLDFLARRLAA
jgi:alpha-beta hydrolase superfamily lysophospholipase